MAEHGGKGAALSLLGRALNRGKEKRHHHQGGHPQRGGTRCLPELGLEGVSSERRVRIQTPFFQESPKPNTLGAKPADATKAAQGATSTAPPTTGSPASQWIQVPQGVPESVVQAALQSAIGAHNLSMGGGVIVTAPPGKKAGKPLQPKAVEDPRDDTDEEEDDDDDDEETAVGKKPAMKRPSAATPDKDEDEGDEEGNGGATNKPGVKRRPAAASIEPAQIGLEGLPAGWKVVYVPRRTNADIRDKRWVSPCGREFDRWKKVENFLSE